jgi:phosphoribosylaminoimidazole-succinocarboxamide synthase
VTGLQILSTLKVANKKLRIAEKAILDFVLPSAYEKQKKLINTIVNTKSGSKKNVIS